TFPRRKLVNVHVFVDPNEITRQHLGGQDFPNERHEALVKVVPDRGPFEVRVHSGKGRRHWIASAGDLLKTSTISGIRSGLYLALQNGETDKEIRGLFLVKAVLFQPPVALAQVFEFTGA